MLNSLLSDWNSCFKKHSCQLIVSDIIVRESNPNASFTELDIQNSRALMIPSNDFSKYNHWGCFCNKNCDGVFLVEVAPNVCDLVAVELKSAYDTNHLYEAKVQIDVSLQKSRVLLNTLSSFATITLRRTYGIIVSNEPDDGSLAWIKSMSTLPRDEWKKDTVGLSLFIDGYYTVQKSSSHICDMVCLPQYDIFYYKSETPTMKISLP